MVLGSLYLPLEEILERRCALFVLSAQEIRDLDEAAWCRPSALLS